MTWKIFLVLGLLALLGFCRRFETSLKFSQLKEHNGWFFVEKFRFAEGVGRFEYTLYVRGKAKSKSNHQLYIQGVPSEKWPNQTQKKCKNPVNMPVMIENMRMTGQKMSNRFQFSVGQEDTYYFVIKDCLNMFRKDYDNEDLTLHIKFHAFSNDLELEDAPEVVEQKEEDSNYEIIEEEAESEEKKQAAEAEKSGESTQGTQSSEVGVVAASTEQVLAEKTEQVKNAQQL